MYCFKKNIGIITFILILAACADSPTVNTTRTVVVNTISNNSWVYFSFDRAEVVDSGSYNWDLAFHWLYIRTNSGVSGVGSGGAFLAGNVDFENYKIPANKNYTVDTYIVDTLGYNRITLELITDSIPMNLVLRNWYKALYNFAVNAQNNIIAGNSVYIVKDASGKPVKFQLKDYYRKNEDGEYFIDQQGNKMPGYIEFTYLKVGGV